ncbi:MAG: UDP-glucuronic acid decarboxylase family protein [bacterium]
MYVLVTGGAGFLGSHLCEYYLAEEHNVFCYDNFVTGNEGNLNDLPGQDRLHKVDQDVTEYIDVEDAYDFNGEPEVDLVLHFASPASPDDYLRYPIKTLKVGALGSHRALGVAKRFDAKFLLASTSEVYGDPLEHPQTEDYWGNVNPIGSRGVYDEAKRFAEAITMAYHKNHDVDTRIVRIFNTYGPRMRIGDGRVVPNFLKQALTGQDLTVYGDGKQTRSFCYVDDLIRGITSLVESNCNQPVNIGNPREMTIMEFAEKVLEVTGSDSGITHEPLPEDDPQVREPDITRAKKVLGWEPDVSLEDGLRKTIPFFKQELGLN